jgi:hypothetical protein
MILNCPGIPDKALNYLLSMINQCVFNGRVMSKVLTITFNDKIALEYDRETRLPGKRRQFLDMMDQDMNEGVLIGGDLVEYPNLNQRAKYVAMNLIDGLDKNDNALVSITCAYLGHRVPDLKEIKASECEDGISMELIYK